MLLRNHPRFHVPTKGPSDILSFYKEEIAGERHNFVHDRARVTDKDAAGVLNDILDEVVGAVTRARSILRGAKEQATWYATWPTDPKERALVVDSVKMWQQC